MALQLSEKDLANPDVLAQKLITLAEIVIRKHFYASIRDKEDLVSVGVLKAYEMINSGNFDVSKGNFMTYLYGGLRNSMHNHLYHEYKFNAEDIEEILDYGREDLYFNNDEVYISYSLIHTVCMSFMPVFGDNIEYPVINALEDMGYTIKGMKEDNKNPSAFLYCDNIVYEYGKEAEDDVISRIIGIILWKKKDKEK